MAWRALTEADLLTQISGPELDGFRAAALGDGQVDPIAPQMTSVVSEVRGYVASNQRNQLGAVGTMPDELITHAAALVVIQLMSRAAGTIIDPNNVRRDAGTAARRVFVDVAAGRFTIIQPTAPIDANTGGPSVTLIRSGGSDRADYGFSGLSTSSNSGASEVNA